MPVCAANRPAWLEVGSKDRRAKSEERRAKSEERREMLHQLRLYYGDNNLRALRLAAFALSSLPLALSP